MRVGQVWRFLPAISLLVLVLPMQPAPTRASSITPSTQVASLPPEAIEADISTRDVPVEGNFAGTRVAVFGAIQNSRQITEDESLYDVAVVIAGPAQQLTARLKADVAGLWSITESLNFSNVPSCYTVLATRPIKDIAPKPVLWQIGIGLDNLRLAPQSSSRPLHAGRAGGRGSLRLYSVRHGTARLHRRQFRDADDDRDGRRDHLRVPPGAGAGAADHTRPPRHDATGARHRHDPASACGGGTGSRPRVAAAYCPKRYLMPAVTSNCCIEMSMVWLVANPGNSVPETVVRGT